MAFIQKLLFRNQGNATAVLLVAGGLGMAALVALSSKISNYAQTELNNQKSASGAEDPTLGFVFRMFNTRDWKIGNTGNGSAQSAPEIISSKVAAVGSPSFISLYIVTGKKTDKGICHPLTKPLLTNSLPDQSSEHCQVNATGFKPVVVDASGVSGLSEPSVGRFAVLGIPNATLAQQYLKAQGKSIYSTGQESPREALKSVLVRFDALTVNGLVVTVFGDLGTIQGVVPLPAASATCVVDNNHTFMTQDGFMEHVREDYKLGDLNTLTAKTGKPWYEPYSQTRYVDWNLCNKLSWDERGHSLYRVLDFKDPAQDGTYVLRVHRVRNRNESPGVNINYSWNSRIAWSGAKLGNFNAHKDYVITCNFIRSAATPWTCSYEVKTQTNLNCARFARGGVTCQELQLAPGSVQSSECSNIFNFFSRVESTDYVGRYVSFRPYVFSSLKAQLRRGVCPNN